jgi:hypothetical protein
MPTTLTGPDVRAWPSLSRAARALGVNKSTLSRRDDLHGERLGQQEIRLSPATVMRLAREYRRRVVDEVAFDLVEYAREQAQDQTEAVEAEIDAYLAGWLAATYPPTSIGRSSEPRWGRRSGASSAWTRQLLDLGDVLYQRPPHPRTPERVTSRKVVPETTISERRSGATMASERYDAGDGSACLSH